MYLTTYTCSRCANRSVEEVEYQGLFSVHAPEKFIWLLFPIQLAVKMWLAGKYQEKCSHWEIVEVLFSALPLTGYYSLTLLFRKYLMNS
jgi:hypothetical protein